MRPAVQTRARSPLRLTPTARHDVGGSAAEPRPEAPVTVALAGQPNIGKSTVFNMLTGLHQHVGNWPGKTVEQKIGACHHGGATARIVDLPGTYSLTANSEEERIARDYLIRERPDVVMAIVNAAALEHSLYLVAELMALGIPLVVGLNMSDVAERHGICIEPHVLQAALGAPVIPLVAARNQGVQEMMDAALAVAARPDDWHPSRPEMLPEHRPVLDELRSMVAGRVPAPYPEEWVSLKLLEGDVEITAMMREALPLADWARVEALLHEHEDAYLDIAGGRYEWIGRMIRAAVTQPRIGVITLTDRLDRIATHPILGLGVLLGLLGFAFWLTYTVATPVAAWLSGRMLALLDGLASAALSGGPPWLLSFVSDGLIHGVGAVLTFVPILVVFFAVLAVLEDIGYLARGAYVMDRFMHLMGLHGKSFLPLFLGFGCNVPAVLGTRILDDRRSRGLTILLAPLVPCTARLAVIAFLAPAFLGRYAAIGSLALVGLNMAVLAITGIATHKLAFRGARTAFIMELPLYHAPNARTVGLYVWNNTLAFVKKAGTLILLASATVWILSTAPGGDIEDSVLAGLGRVLAPAGAWMGLTDWRMIVALLTSFFAKENAIATLGVLYGAESGMLAASAAAALEPAARLAFLVVVMLFVPCLATVVTIQQETRSWRMTAASVGLQLMLSLGAGVAVYQLGRLLGA